MRFKERFEVAILRDLEMVEGSPKARNAGPAAEAGKDKEGTLP